MKNKKNILKYQFSGVMQDATTVKKPDRQIVVKNNNDNWKQLVAKNQPKQQTRLFELTPEIKKDIEEHTKKGDVQLTNGEWITKEEYNKLKAKKSTGAINPDYSDPITMGITMVAAPAQGLVKTVANTANLGKVGKTITKGLELIDPTEIGLFNQSKIILNKSLKDLKQDEVKQYVFKHFEPYLKDKSKTTGKSVEDVYSDYSKLFNADKSLKDNLIDLSYNHHLDFYDVIKHLDNYDKNIKEKAVHYGKKKLKETKQNVNEKIEDYKNKILSKNPDINEKDLETTINSNLIIDGFGDNVNVKVTKSRNGFIDVNINKNGNEEEGLIKLVPNYRKKSSIGFIDNFLKKIETPFYKSNYLGNEGLRKHSDYPNLQDIKGAAPNIHNSINQFLKDNKLGNLLSGGTGHTSLGRDRWDKLVNKGVAEKINGEYYKLKKQGGVFEEGGKLDCGCNIDKDEIDTDVLFDLPQQIFDLLGKSIGLKKGTKYDNKVKDKLKEDAKLNNMNLRDYLMKNPDVSKHITIIEMKRQGGLLGYQTGGLVSNITNSQNVNNKTNEVVMQYNIKQPVVKELQQGGQLDEKQFIQWLAQQLGATDENDFKQKVQKLGKGGIEKAKQMFMQQSQKMEQGGYLPRYKRGGIFKYQNAGVFRSFADTENRSVNNITEDPQKGTKKSSYTFIPGTYDVESKIANTYNNINSSQQFDAGTTNAQSKIDYSKGVGQRTQSGLQGNRGKQGINLTDRLASERQDVQNTFEKVYNTPEFTKRMYKAKDGNTYLLDTTGKYVIGKLDQKEETVPPTPTSANPKINRPVRFGLVVADNKEMADGKVAKGTLTFELGTDKENKEYLRQADPKTANSLLMLNSADNPYDTGKHTSFNDGQNERAFYQKQLEDLMKDENSELRKLLKSYQNKATATEQEVLEKPKPTINRLGGILKYQSRKWR